ncbi:MAG TPA: dihydroorotate dehydrogenase [Nitrospiria bacterium]|nr:dihydroorotate dehydrogenase [Nitrospiria bacterium]
MSAQSPSLTVDLGDGLVLKNPIIAASGTFGYGEEYAGVLDVNRLGAIVVKGLSVEPKTGNPTPRLIETPSGLLNAIGLANVGLEAFLSDKLPFLRRFDVKVIVNIFGGTIEEFERLTDRLSDAQGVHALEVNVSCPNVKQGGMNFGQSVTGVFEVVRAVRRKTRLPMIVKLSPNVTDIAEIAKAAHAAGASALSVINTVLGMAIDVETRRPKLASWTGGLSGPAIRPIAVRMVWEVSRAVPIPIIGLGGVTCAEDAVEFLLAGASAVAVGTANFMNPRATIDVLDGLTRYMARHNVHDVRQLVGAIDVTGRG